MIRRVRVGMTIGKGLVMARMIVLVSEVVSIIGSGGFRWISDWVQRRTEHPIIGEPRHGAGLGDLEGAEGAGGSIPGQEGGRLLERVADGGLGAVAGGGRNKFAWGLARPRFARRGFRLLMPGQPPWEG